MSVFDYFVGTLKCSICKNISDSNSSTNMQTKIRENPNYEELGVGRSLQINQYAIDRGNYTVLRWPAQNENIVILDMWECQFCDKGGRNWAKIIVQNGVISEVFSVEKTQQVVNHSHFISDECLHDLED